MINNTTTTHTSYSDSASPTIPPTCTEYAGTQCDHVILALPATSAPSHEISNTSHPTDSELNGVAQVLSRMAQTESCTDPPPPDLDTVAASLLSLANSPHLSSNQTTPVLNTITNIPPLKSSINIPGSVNDFFELPLHCPVSALSSPQTLPDALAELSHKNEEIFLLRSKLSSVQLWASQLMKDRDHALLEKETAITRLQHLAQLTNLRSRLSRSNRATSEQPFQPSSSIDAADPNLHSNMQNLPTPSSYSPNNDHFTSHLLLGCDRNSACRNKQQSAEFELSFSHSSLMSALHPAKQLWSQNEIVYSSHKNHTNFVSAQEALDNTRLTNQSLDTLGSFDANRPQHLLSSLGQHVCLPKMHCESSHSMSSIEKSITHNWRHVDNLSNVGAGVSSLNNCYLPNGSFITGIDNVSNLNQQYGDQSSPYSLLKPLPSPQHSLTSILDCDSFMPCNRKKRKTRMLSSDVSNVKISTQPNSSPIRAKVIGRPANNTVKYPRIRQSTAQRCESGPMVSANITLILGPNGAKPIPKPLPPLTLSFELHSKRRKTTKALPLNVSPSVKVINWDCLSHVDALPTPESEKLMQYATLLAFEWRTSGETFRNVLRYIVEAAPRSVTSRELHDAKLATYAGVRSSLMRLVTKQDVVVDFPEECPQGILKLLCAQVAPQVLTGVVPASVVRVANIIKVHCPNPVASVGSSDGDKAFRLPKVAYILKERWALVLKPMIKVKEHCSDATAFAHDPLICVADSVCDGHNKPMISHHSLPTEFAACSYGLLADDQSELSELSSSGE